MGGEHHHGHGHNHAHAADGTTVTLVGAALNVVLTVSKLLCGYYTRSPSLVADGVHSASDLVADCITLVAFSVARRPRDAHYPFGYRKYETVGSLLISVILVSTSVGLVLHALHPEHEDDSSDSIWPIVFIALSLVIKETLYRYTRAIAIRQKSDVLLANAQHHRSDALGSFMAGAAILTSTFFHAHGADRLGGIAVAAMIAKEAIPIGLGACADLVDRVDPKEAKLLLASVEDALDVRKVGDTAFVTVKGKPRKVDTSALLQADDSIKHVWVSFDSLH